MALATLQIDPALPIVALRIPNVGELSRKEREDNHPLFDQKKGAKFIDDFKRLAKSLPDSAAKIRELAGAAEGDFVIVVAGDPAHHIKASDTKFPRPVERARDQRVLRGRQLPQRAGEEVCGPAQGFSASPMRWSKARNHGVASDRWTASKAFHPIWIIDFPMFEYDLASGQWMPAHHPFTAPYEADMANLTSDPASVRADCYDLAMNGLELGSGSIRIHRKDVQQQIFASLGISR